MQLKLTIQPNGQYPVAQALGIPVFTIYLDDTFVANAVLGTEIQEMLEHLRQKNIAVMMDPAVSDSLATLCPNPTDLAERIRRHSCSLSNSGKYTYIPCQLCERKCGDITDLKESTRVVSFQAAFYVVSKLAKLRRLSADAGIRLLQSALDAALPISNPFDFLNCDVPGCNTAIK